MLTRRKRLALFRNTGFESLEDRRLLAFGLTTTSSSYTVDSGGGLVFSILRGGTVTSTIHMGDLTSVKYNGTELLAPYSATSRYSHYEQGLGSTTVLTATIDPSPTPQWIKITADDSAGSGIIQYYVAKRNDANLYMASLPLDVNVGPGEGRFIAYLSKSVFTNIEGPSDISANVGAVEGSDVFYNADGTTASKFYNMGRRMIENTVHGVTGAGVGIYMNMGNREHSAGGPFFKDIDFQTTSGATEIYNCLFTGHTQTEAFRQGLEGPYALQLTNGSAPTAPDYSFLEGVGIQGLVPASGRGSLSGVASGMVSGHETVIGLSNSSAQYWGYANASGGAFSITGVMPGTYTMTMYDNELAVGTRTITITAQANTTANIMNTYVLPAATWRIGVWDGTPVGFLNSDKIEIMHPSDVRMTSWTSTPNFVIGTNTDSQFPMVEWKDGNNGQRITFNLTSTQAAQAQTLRIGITLGFEGGRDQIVVNTGQTYAYTSSIPSATTDLNSRGITRGTWRGPNQLYTYSIPTSALKAGTNTIDLNVVSGTAGTGFLSPNVVYDAIDLVPTATLTATPVVTSVTLTPSSSRVGAGAQINFIAAAKDQFGNAIATNFSFSTTSGTIDPAGVFIAQATTGVDTITVSSGSVSATAQVTVVGPTPLVVNPASALPNPTANGITALSVLGDDDGTEANLTYTWSVVGTPPGSVSFSANGTNAAKNTTATLGAPGNYNLLATVRDASGNTITSSVTVSYRDYVVRYKADDTSGATLADSSGGNNTAALTSTYNFVTGRSVNAVQLTGGYASLPTGILSAVPKITIATWVKIDTLSTWSRIFDFGTGQSVYMFLTPRATSTSGPVRFSITNSGGGTEQQINGTTALPTGVWTHVAVTLNGSVGTLYVNGVQVGQNNSMTLNPTSLGSTTLNYLGKSQYSDPAFLGSIDDFRIYARALSASEVSALVSTALPAAPSGLTATSASSSQINLSWSAVAGATSYNIYRATTTGGPYTQIATTTSALTYQDTGLTATLTTGTTFYYVVSAENVGGEGARSAEAQATVLRVAITTTADSGAGSLRQAILDANATTATNAEYSFAIPGSGLQSIQLATPLPNILRAAMFNIPTGSSVGIGVSSANTLAEFPSITLIGGGSLAVGGSQSHTSASTINVSAGGLTLSSDAGTNVSIVGGAPITFTSTQHLASLSVNAGITVGMTASGDKALVLGGISLASGAKLDLADNSLIVHSTAGAQSALLNTLNALLAMGYAAVNPHWAGPGINSSSATNNAARTTALGILSNNTVSGARFTTFDNEPVVATDILVKYTYYGDGNLDGVVSSADYALTDNGFNFGQTGWGNGDFNFDGAVNGADYALLDNGYNFQSGPLTSETLTPLSLQAPIASQSAAAPTVNDLALAAYLYSLSESNHAIDDSPLSPFRIRK